MKPLYIFDLDGTIYNVEHRLPILADKTNKMRWDDFYLGCVRDTQFDAVVSTAIALRQTSEIWFWTGRSDLVRYQTIKSLVAVFNWDKQYIDDRLRMRGLRNHIDDDQLKNAWYQSLQTHNKKRLVAVFEDRDRVVDMWRKNRVTCFQPCRGNF